jgi:hypothetical protein
MNVKPRERNAILQSLGAGVVPHVGLHHIQVGRKLELEALINDLARIGEGGASIRFVIGRFGSGKSFFLNLVRTVALERKFVIAQADITIDRRLHGAGASKALYTELVNGISTRAKPEGGAMPGLVERFVSDASAKAGAKADPAAIEAIVGKELQPLLELTHGSSFVRVIARYVEGFSKHDEKLVNCATRWLRGEYGTKTEAREDLGVRDIIEDGSLYDMLKVWAGFAKIAGYSGLLVNLDEMVVLSERLNNTTARTKNYEVVLQILNDCLQGGVSGLGFCFAGTEEFLTDRRRGLFSYEALATRLADNPFAAKGVVDTKGPVIRLLPLTKEDLFVLLERIGIVQAAGNKEKILVEHDGLVRFMAFCEKRLGSEHFLTPRDTVKQFIGLLNVMEQNPGRKLDDFLNAMPEPSAGESSAKPVAEGDSLAKFTL